MLKRKVVLIGPPKSGKSTLSLVLEGYYQLVTVEEQGWFLTSKRTARAVLRGQFLQLDDEYLEIVKCQSDFSLAGIISVQAGSRSLKMVFNDVWICEKWAKYITAFRLGLPLPSSPFSPWEITAAPDTLEGYSIILAPTSCTS